MSAITKYSTSTIFAPIHEGVGVSESVLVLLRSNAPSSKVPTLLLIWMKLLLLPWRSIGYSESLLDAAAPRRNHRRTFERTAIRPLAMETRSRRDGAIGR